MIAEMPPHAPLSTWPAAFVRPLSTRAQTALQRYEHLTGLKFVAVDRGTGCILPGPRKVLCPDPPDDVMREWAAAQEPFVVTLPSGLVYYGLPFPDDDESDRLALGCLPADPASPPAELVLAAEAAGWSDEEWECWLAQQPCGCPELLRRLLQLAAEQSRTETERATADHDLEALAAQLDNAYEELNLLYSIARHLRVTLDPTRLARTSLQKLHACLRSSGCAIYLSEPPSHRGFFHTGDQALDALQLAELFRVTGHADWSQPCVRNHLEFSPLSHGFPRVRNFVAAAIPGGDGPAGWIVAWNARDGEFGSVEACLMQSIGAMFGTHLRNTLLFHEQEDLLVDFVRSMVSALDAKDTYTRGHSERVALLARRIGTQLGLPESKLQTIYLSGLLHDVGKIGISDHILKKPGPLTAEEFRDVQKHPVIGDQILSGLKNLKHVLPGVRNHHENFDGTGYPDRLAGERIPAMARILAVADAFDAMGSNRPYRPGIPLERVKSILAAGAGKQWDPAVVAACFEAWEDLQRMWTSQEAALPESPAAEPTSLTADPVSPQPGLHAAAPAPA